MDTQKLNFNHLPLKTQLEEIRLLRILPGESPLSCEIEHFSFDDCPPYLALSYTWGDPTTTRSLLLNGQEVRITENLGSFLQHARPDAETSVDHWIDTLLAIFCDHGENTEHNCKPSWKQWIYRLALRLIVWLSNYGRPDKPNYYWIDALCISQSDVTERSQQVSRMKEIYTQAQEVIIWLGSAADDSDIAIRAIVHLAKINLLGPSATEQTL